MCQCRAVWTKGAQSNQLHETPRATENQLIGGHCGPLSFHFGNFLAQRTRVGRIIAEQTHSLRFTGLPQLHPDSRIQLGKPVAHKTKMRNIKREHPSRIAVAYGLSLKLNQCSAVQLIWSIDEA